MIQPLRDPHAMPIEPQRETSYTTAYIHDVDRLGMDSSVLRGRVDGPAAYRQAVWKIVNTERYAYRNTPPNAGIEMRQFINRSPNYFRARIERVMRSALMQDDRTLEVHLLRTEKTGPRSVAAWFRIISVYGEMIEGFDILLSQGRATKWLTAV